MENIPGLWMFHTRLLQGVVAIDPLNVYSQIWGVLFSLNAVLVGSTCSFAQLVNSHNVLETVQDLDSAVIIHSHSHSH